jgi:nitroreductase
MELKEAIEQRRSIRKFTDEQVTDEQLKEVLEAARMAPSWANTQVWEFIIIREREMMERIAETYSETNPARRCTENASALIVVCAKNGISGCKEGKQVTKFNEWFMFDLGLAVQNLSLRAHELGLGTVIAGLFDHDRCGEMLSVPDGYEVVAAIPVGVPAVAGKKAPPRKELGEFVHKESFGKNYF